MKIGALTLNTLELLQLAPDLFDELAPDAASKTSICARVVAELRSDDRVRGAFLRSCRYEGSLGATWIHAAGEDQDYLSFELLEQALSPGERTAAFAEILLSDSTAIPYDYRAQAGEKLLALDPSAYRPRIEKILSELRVSGLRSTADKLLSPTDGIDHLFPIPATVEERLAMLERASAKKTEESRFLLCFRLSRALGWSAPGAETYGALEQLLAGAFSCAEAEKRIAADVTCRLIHPADYLVPWDQELLAPHTLAELLRITLMCGEFKLPDSTVRPALVRFYRSVLRISGRAIIGLAAGVFHVEHGSLAAPSYCYMGRDSALGKGCVVDGVGGVVVESGAFLGGGFMPILIHTHKHLRNANEPGIAERKRILPCVFGADRGARLPMHAIGLFETAEYLEHESPYPGIRALALDRGVR